MSTCGHSTVRAPVVRASRCTTSEWVLVSRRTADIPAPLTARPNASMRPVSIAWKRQNLSSAKYLISKRATPWSRKQSSNRAARSTVSSRVRSERCSFVSPAGGFPSRYGCAHRAVSGLTFAPLLSTYPASTTHVPSVV